VLLDQAAVCTYPMAVRTYQVQSCTSPTTNARSPEFPRPRASGCSPGCRAQPFPVSARSPELIRLAARRC